LLEGWKAAQTSLKLRRARRARKLKGGFEEFKEEERKAGRPDGEKARNQSKV